MEVRGLQEALKVEIQCQSPTLCKGLSERANGQKLAVRSCPVGAAKPLPAKTPVSMVTAHLNGSEQSAVGGAWREPAPPQVLAAVPPVSSLHRLAASVLPQVRPKTQIPESLPSGPRQDLQPGGLQKATAVVSPQSHAPHTATGSTSPSQHAGVAYAIIASAAASEAVKVIIIQPQAPGLSEAPPTPSQKKEEDPEKVSFMVALGLVTMEQLEEIQLRRLDRKRRSTANPAYSEPERKRPAYLSSSFYLASRDSEDFCSKQPEPFCSVCQAGGALQPCSRCPRSFHPACLHPPLLAPPRGPWFCPRCQKKVLNKENVAWPRNAVSPRTVRQEEKRRLLRRNGELRRECCELEEEAKRVSGTLQVCVGHRDGLLGQQTETRASLDRLKALLRLIRVTMKTPRD